MITFWIIVGIAICIWLVVVAWNCDGFWFTVLGPGVLGGLVIAVATFLVLALAHVVMRTATGYHWNHYNSPLVALTDERSVTGGSFFLGSGFVGTNASYVFYTASDDGARLMSQVDATGVKVYEDSETPYARYQDQRVFNHPEWIPLISLAGDRRPVLIELHVPPRSIKTGISLGVSE